MYTLPVSDIQAEVELIERFVRSYRKHIAAAIDELNRHSSDGETSTPQTQCLRLCVETMDMVLYNQDRLAKALRRLAGETPVRKVA